MRAYSFARSKAQLHRYLRPSPLSADCVKAPFLVHQLEQREKNVLTLYVETRVWYSYIYRRGFCNTRE